MDKELQERLDRIENSLGGIKAMLSVVLAADCMTTTDPEKAAKVFTEVDNFLANMEKQARINASIAMVKDLLTSSENQKNNDPTKD
jgi:hypothetical protein